MRVFLLQLITILALLVIWFMTLSCAPSPSELIGSGLNCKANITMPEGWRGEAVTVDVKIFDCKDVSRRDH